MEANFELVSERLIPWVEDRNHLVRLVRELAEREAASAARVAVEKGEGDYSITPSQTRRCLDKALEIGGLDWFEVSLWVQWDSSKMNELATKLGRCKSSGVAFDGAVTFERDGGEVVTVQPGGRRMGPIYAEYIVETEGLNLSLVMQPVPEESRPNIFLQIGSVPLMQAGILTMLEALDRLSYEWGFTVERSAISRVDLCVDLPGVPMEWFGDLFSRDCYVSRAKKDRTYRENRRVTGIDIGRGDIMCRIYDKITEVDQQTLKAEVLKECRYGGAPLVATRVEFQLRGPKLKDKLGGNTIEHVLPRLGALASYLTADWLRFTADPVDRDARNQDKAALADLWKLTRQAFELAFPPELPRGKPQQYRPFSPQLVKQALGCIRSAAAACGIKWQGKETFLRTMWGMLEKVIDDWAAEGNKWQDRAAKISAMQPRTDEKSERLVGIAVDDRWQALYDQWASENLAFDPAEYLGTNGELSDALLSWQTGPMQGDLPGIVFSKSMYDRERF